MDLSPREKDKLLLFTVALLAERRKARGLPPGRALACERHAAEQRARRAPKMPGVRAAVLRALVEPHARDGPGHVAAEAHPDRDQAINRMERALAGSGSVTTTVAPLAINWSQNWRTKAEPWPWFRRSASPMYWSTPRVPGGWSSKWWPGQARGS